MEVIIQFLKDNWSLVISVVVLILSFILQLIKKKPVDDIASKIFSYCVDGVLLAEKTSSKGIEKLTIAIKYVEDCLLKHFPNLDISLYYFTIKNTIELILKTPQKKV